jgi:hypothetical protein
VAVSSPWLAPALTLLTVGATFGAIFDSNHRTTFVIVTCVIVAATFAMAVRDRILKRSPDFRLAAPALLSLTALAAESFHNLETPGLVLLTAVLTYFFGRRSRTAAGVAEAAAAVSLAIVGSFLTFLAIIGGTRMAPILLIATTIWLVVWMPSRTRRVHDQDTLHVARSPDEVSAFLLDQRHLPLWYPGYVSSELEPDSELGVGATFRQIVEVRDQPMEAYVLVDEYEPGRRLCTRVIQAPGNARGCYTFSAEPGGTVAIYEYDGEQLYPTALIGGRLFVWDAISKVRTQRSHAFDKLKSILEA